MMSWYGGFGWGGWIVMSVLMVGFWALVVFGGIALYRSLQGNGTRSDAQPVDAERLLDERFARGEIDVEDYKQRRELLRTGR